MKIMEMMSNIGSGIQKMAGMTRLKLKKNSPEILLGIGIAGFIGTVVLASRETLKVKEIIDEHNETMALIDEAVGLEHEKELFPGYADEEAPKERVIASLQTAGKIAKLYYPSVTLGVISLACIVKSHSIMEARYLGAVAAFNAVTEAFKAYRSRVIEEEGVDMDRHYRYGTEFKKEAIEKKDENGDTVKKKEVVENTDSKKIGLNDFCRVMDESNPNWDKNPSMLMMFLKGQQNVANNILHTRGYIFLNEVYELLGFEATPEGQIVGWLDGEGVYIDFGLYDYENGNVPRFVNGQSNIVLLDFNHQGVIYEHI